jgi:protein-S-isoprenylcysteine O-methyltransferase Ste14
MGVVVDSRRWSPGRTGTGRRVSAALVNVSLAGLYVLFIIRHADAFVATHAPTLLAIVVLETMVVTMFLTRRDASVSNLSPLALTATALGTFSTLLMAPIERSGVPSFVTVGIQLLGLGMAIVALGSLRRSFGLVPANRGVQTSGMYRFVRHPLYASYLVTFAGYLLAYPAARNFALLAASIVGQLLRMSLEERLLLRDQQYADYAARTRFRLIPGVY